MVAVQFVTPRHVTLQLLLHTDEYACIESVLLLQECLSHAL